MIFIQLPWPDGRRGILTKRKMKISVNKNFKGHTSKKELCKEDLNHQIQFCIAHDGCDIAHLSMQHHFFLNCFDVKYPKN